MKKWMLGIRTWIVKHKLPSVIIAVAAVLVAVVLIVGTTTGAIPAFSQKKTVLFSFECQDGSVIEPIEFKKGDKIGILPETQKRGYDFGGWYYDKDFWELSDPEDIAEEDTTLYARFFASQVTNNTTQFVEKCEPDIAFILHSNEELNNDNLTEYLTLESAGGPIADLKVENLGDNKYQVSAQDGFTRGYTNILTSKMPEEVYF